MTKFTSGKNFPGEELRKIRKERGLTLQELDNKLNISYSYIARIEKGEKEPDELVREKLEVWMATGEVPKFAVTTMFEGITQKQKEILEVIESDPDMAVTLKGMRQLSREDRRKVKDIIFELLADRPIRKE